MYIDPSGHLAISTLIIGALITTVPGARAVAATVHALYL